MATTSHPRPTETRICATKGCNLPCLWISGGNWCKLCEKCLEKLRLRTLRILGWSEQRIAETTS